MALPPSTRDLLHRQHGVATSRQLKASGLSERSIATAARRGILYRLHRGAYAHTDDWRAAEPPLRLLMRLLAVQLSAPDAVGCGATAATSCQLPVRAVPRIPTVIRPPGLGLLAGASVRRSPLGDADRLLHAGLLVTSLPRTVIDIAAEADLADALITADAALRRGVALEDLRRAVDGRLPAQGRPRASSAIELADPYSETWLESLSRGRAIERGMPLPLCNVVLRFEGRWVRVDMLWAELGVIGECDGKGKYRDPNKVSEVVWKEKRRGERLEDMGFEVARWGTKEVIDTGAVMEFRFRRAAARQQAVGSTWPATVTAELPLLAGAKPTARIVAEVKRLASGGLPICFVDDDGRRVDPGRWAA